MVVAPFVYSNTITTAVTRLKSLVIITKLFYLVVYYYAVRTPDVLVHFDHGARPPAAAAAL